MKMEFIDGYLFSEGVRVDCSPDWYQEESSFGFLDRVRQPYFDRLRRFYENIFSTYPEGNDKVDLCQRFRSSDNANHQGAEWELYNFGLFSSLGFSLVPHPKIGRAPNRDFLVQKDGKEFLLECVVSTPSKEKRKERRGWDSIRKQLEGLMDTPLSISLYKKQTGSNLVSLSQDTQSIKNWYARAQKGIDPVATYDREGWHFELRYLCASPTPSVSVGEITVQSINDSYFDPLRKNPKKKGKNSRDYEIPYVVSFQMASSVPPWTSDVELVEQAFIGDRTSHLSQDGHTERVSTRSNGVFGTKANPHNVGMSAILLRQGGIIELPTLLHNPNAQIPFDMPLPFEEVSFTSEKLEYTVMKSQESSANKLFDLSEEWPGPENRFEGINTDSESPKPAFWSPKGT